MLISASGLFCTAFVVPFDLWSVLYLSIFSSVKLCVMSFHTWFKWLYVLSNPCVEIFTSPQTHSPALTPDLWLVACRRGAVDAHQDLQPLAAADPAQWSGEGLRPHHGRRSAGEHPSCAAKGAGCRPG